MDAFWFNFMPFIPLYVPKWLKVPVNCSERMLLSVAITAQLPVTAQGFSFY